MPRFALSVTTTTLAALGELWHEYQDRGVYVTTHISENGGPAGGEVAEVRRSFGVEEYLDVYDGRFLPGSRVGGPTLLGRRTVLAHAVHCSDGEFARMAEAGHVGGALPGLAAVPGLGHPAVAPGRRGRDDDRDGQRHRRR